MEGESIAWSIPERNRVNARSKRGRRGAVTDSRCAETRK